MVAQPADFETLRTMVDRSCRHGKPRFELRRAWSVAFLFWWRQRTPNQPILATMGKSHAPFFKWWEYIFLHLTLSRDPTTAR